jgi:hypothetical protein
MRKIYQALKINDVVLGKFIWHRGKSNQTVDDVGGNKGGPQITRITLIFAPKALFNL